MRTRGLGASKRGNTAQTSGGFCIFVPMNLPTRTGGGAVGDNHRRRPTLVCDIQVPCFLAYPSSPTPQVARFVDAMRRALAERGR